MRLFIERALLLELFNSPVLVVQIWRHYLCRSLSSDGEMPWKEQGAETSGTRLNSIAPAGLTMPKPHI